VVTIYVLDDGDGVISDYNRNFHFLSANLSQEVAFLGLPVVAMLGTIVTALSE